MKAARTGGGLADIEKTYSDSSYTSGNYGIGQYEGDSLSHSTYTDWFRVRPIVANEPTYSFGDEEVFSWTNIGNHSESSILNWNITNISEQSDVDLRCKAIDLNGSNYFSDYYEPGVNLSIGIVIPSDPQKFNITNSTGQTVAWLGTNGNIVLKGNCFSGTTCSTPGPNSLILKNSTQNPTAYINSTGDLCITNSCQDQSATCNPPTSAFIIKNKSTQLNMSYIDINGDLCLTGGLYENALS